MSYNHITIEERACIKKLIQEGSTARKIAEYLGRAPSTISREIRRNKGGNGVYHPTTANRKYKSRRIRCHRSVKLNQETIDYLTIRLELNWSPEQIYERSKMDNDETVPSCSTIYRWIHKDLLPRVEMRRLRRKGRFKRPQETRGRFNVGTSIRKRPREVYKRTEVGHWEADTVESGRIGHVRKSSFCLVTLVERKARFTLSMVLPNRKEETVTPAIIKLFSTLPKDMVKTITCDRGKEFSGYREIEAKLNCNVYFADPYCAWQRGTNENTNGLLREYYPKGMDLSEVTQNDLDIKLDLLNSRPRKCIEFKKPKEVLHV